MLNSIFRALQPRTTAYAHCDLPCGVYDPSQARLEAESVKACMEKYHASDDAEFRARAVSIKEERSHMVKSTCGCCGPITSSRRTSRGTRS